MKRLLKIELKKAVCSKAFLAGVGVLMFFVLLSAVYTTDNWRGNNPDYLYEYCMENGEYTANPTFSLSSLFDAWVGGDGLSLAYTLFFALMPVGAALPFAWSFHSERKSGYLKNIAVRTDRNQYLAAKTIAVFVSGALAVLLAFLVNILIVSAFIPYYPPWVGNNLYNQVYFGTLWADLFFEAPFLHMFLYVLLNTVYGGIFALLSYAVSFYTKKLVTILFAPFLFMLLAKYVEELITYRFFTNSVVTVELVPTSFLHSRALHFFQFPFAVGMVTAVLLAFAVGTVIWRGRNYEIY